MDNWLSSIIHHRFFSFLIPIMKAFDFIGYTYFVLGVCFITLISLYFIAKRRLDSFLFFVTMIGERIISECLRTLFSRSRPNGLYLVDVDKHSFPSQHAMNSLVLYGILLFLLWKHFKSTKKSCILLTSSHSYLSNGDKSYIPRCTSSK